MSQITLFEADREAKLVLSDFNKQLNKEMKFVSSETGETAVECKMEVHPNGFVTIRMYGTPKGPSNWLKETIHKHKASATFLDISSDSNFFHAFEAEKGESASEIKTGFISEESIASVGTAFFIKEFVMFCDNFTSKEQSDREVAVGVKLIAEGLINEGKFKPDEYRRAEGSLLAIFYPETYVSFNDESDGYTIHATPPESGM